MSTITDGETALEGSGEMAVFSEEEQREIAERIEAASARGRNSVPPVKGAASRRSVFPLLVNAAALLVLAGGFAALTTLHSAEAVEIRETGARLGITERALIQEIRRETDRRLGEKENAIAAMNARISGVEEELARLDSLEALSDEQRKTMDELRHQQEEYRSSLGQLQSERALILAESMQREAALRTRLEEQRGAMEALSEQSRAEIKAAADELSRLSSEQEKSLLIERQMGGYFTLAEKQVQTGHYREAMETIAVLREFLNTPSFRTIPRFQARRESALAAANALSLGMAEMLRAGGAAAVSAIIGAEQPQAPAAPPAQGGGETALRQQLADREAVLAERERNIRELERNIGELQSATAAGQRTIQERDRQLEALRAQNTAYAQTIQTQQRTMEALSAELERR